jgi:hypothetical protein
MGLVTTLRIECHYAECCYTEYRDYLNVMLSAITLNVIMLAVVRLNDVMLSVVAPKVKMFKKSV